MTDEAGTRWAATSFARNVRNRAVGRLKKKFSDAEVRQLRSLQRVYASESGPEVLLFGDSAMFWTLLSDRDHRHLVNMLRDELGGQVSFEALVGPGYNPRMVLAFLEALGGCRARPKVVLVPASVLMASTLWLSHPRMSYEVEAVELRRLTADGARSTRRIRRTADGSLEEFDRLPTPSLYGARRTAGELRLIINSTPETKWQTAVRTRHMLDAYNAEQLTPESLGVRLVGQMGAALGELDLPSVAYIAPVNHELLKITLGEIALERLRDNAAVVESAFLQTANSRGRVVNAAFDSPAVEFSDPVHLGDAGRARLARRLAETMRPLM